MTTDTGPWAAGAGPPARRDQHMAFGRVGAKVHMAPGKGWPESARGRMDCGSAGRGRRLEKVLFQVSAAFEDAYSREFGQDRRAWSWFQLAEHGVPYHRLCFKCFSVAYRRGYAIWLKTVKAHGLPVHLERMIPPPAGASITDDSCPITGTCRLPATHVLFFYDPEDQEWAKTPICFPHGATWELGEGLWDLTNRAAALLPIECDQLSRKRDGR